MLRHVLITLIILFQGCGNLNIEVQQTQRTHSSAARNPVIEGVDIQGSSRVQGKSPTGINAQAKVSSDNTKATHLGSDVSGAEK